MGNLSCVSCKVQDKEAQKSIGELGLTDYKGASFHPDTVREVASDAAPPADGTQTQVRTESDEENPDLLFWDKIKASKKASESGITRLTGDAIITDTDEIEKAAKLIVDMTVFLTSQVIYPAYLRYLREDHPDLYKQYFEQPTTPLITEGEELGGGDGRGDDLSDDLSAMAAEDEEYVTGIIYHCDAMAGKKAKKGTPS